MIQSDLNIRSEAIYKIILEIYEKKTVCFSVPHDLTHHQKARRIRVSNEPLKPLNHGGYHIISKIIIIYTRYIQFLFSLQQNKNNFGLFLRQDHSIFLRFLNLTWVVLSLTDLNVVRNLNKLYNLFRRSGIRRIW